MPGGFIAFAWVFYLVIPNPYELSHLPEYVILGALALHAPKGDVEGSEKAAGRPPYFRSAVITSVVGTIMSSTRFFCLCGILPGMMSF
jgi:hypothetical protein